MSNEALGRLAWAGVVAIVGANELFDRCEFNPGGRFVVIWLIAVAGCGLVLDTRAGSSRRDLALRSLALCGIAVFAVVYLTVVATQSQALGNETVSQMGPMETARGVCISGLSIHNPVFWVISPIILVATWLAIFLFSFARDPNIRFIERLKPGKAKDWLAGVDSLLRTAASLLAAIVLLLGQWNETVSAVQDRSSNGATERSQAATQEPDGAP